MMPCSYCGQSNEDSLAYCAGCGEALAGRPLTAAAPPMPLPEPPADKDTSEFTTHFYAATPRVWVTYALLGLNCAIYLLMGLAGSNLVHPHITTLLDWGANWGPMTTTSGGWWRLLAAAFLHFTVFHLLCNMLALWQAGVLAERLFGNGFFLAIYLGTGLVSSLNSLDWHPDIISAGASGAIFGVYGALLGYLAHQRGALPRRIWASLGKTILAFVALNLFYGLTQLQVDNAAHLGGLLAGLMLGWAAARPLRPPSRQAAARRAAWQLAVGMLLLVVPFAALAPTSRPEYGKLLNDMGETVAVGSDGPRNPVAAAWWYQQAAHLGNAAAEFNLGQRYFNASSGVVTNPLAGVQWLRQAADHGSTNAEITLGMIYFNGTGVPVDHAEARRWIARAAAHGVPSQQFLLGQMDYQGDGTDRDPAAAFQWIHQAAEQGLPAAQTQLAGLYLNGKGTATNTVEAIRWARTAADHGQPGAQYILGTLYATGHGLPLDEVEAYAWFTLVAAGSPPLAPAADQVLSQLAGNLTPAQLDGARHRVTELAKKITSLTRPLPAIR